MKDACTANQAEHLAVLLDEAAEQIKAGRRAVCSACRTDELAARLQKDRFHLAVLGQFKRGKSSLIMRCWAGSFCRPVRCR
ncbi:hypothetical protein [Sporomusa acidovorans]|uniref:Dynamin family protein n=1 Tax=Sporomusa acidovorans (strain ATCC 49682 / DSM 3132 / Mol) TaxID=1123286 RepID=A0ABZ3J2U7_SPOA4|nr:hypothetical protein [Sporomusa acidovorans]OZC24003.1 hypothetical protein SPACI_03270 [Sporomusa acidovorans DSM 3132]SDF83656.1 hypothetical protein SAMN04488499_10956 [Sporomusa acidovorans]